MARSVVRQKGFTLVEILVVLAIVSVISAIAYSSYSDNIIKTHRADAQATLVTFAAAMERFYVANGSYEGASDGDDSLGEIPAAAVFASESPLESATKLYDLRMNTAATTFTLHAIPKGKQAGDGRLRYTSTGERSWDKENNGTYTAPW
jgi:type IV pilus assembly protein PilE